MTYKNARAITGPMQQPRSRQATAGATALGLTSGKTSPEFCRTANPKQCRSPTAALHYAQAEVLSVTQPESTAVSRYAMQRG